MVAESKLPVWEPVMVEWVDVVAQRDELQEHMRLGIVNAHPPALILHREGRQPRRFEGGDLFACLLEVRRDLELDGWLMCCQGARPDVFPSGLLTQEANGRLAYHLVPGRPAVNEDIVDVFAPADISEVSTVIAQHRFVARMFGLKEP